MEERVVNQITDLMDSFKQRWIEASEDEIKEIEENMYCGRLHPSKVWRKQVERGRGLASL